VIYRPVVFGGKPAEAVSAARSEKPRYSSLKKTRLIDNKP